jgi:hypothetical protein
LAREARAAMETQRRESLPPSLWQLFKRMTHPDARRGLSFVTSMLPRSAAPGGNINRDLAGS